MTWPAGLAPAPPQASPPGNWHREAAGKSRAPRPQGQTGDVATVDALSQAEASALDQCEQTIDKGIKSFVEVGTALVRIRDQRLYRTTCATFGEYIKARFPQLSRSSIYRAIDTATVVEIVSPIGDVPNEAQARELAPLRDRPEAMRAAWQDASDSTGGKPTAAAVKEAREDIAPKPPVKVTPIRELEKEIPTFSTAERDARQQLWEELWPTRKRASTHTAAQRVARYVLAHSPQDACPPSWSASNVTELSPAAQSEMVGVLTDAIKATSRSLKHLRELRRVLDAATGEADPGGAGG